jgi:hypothetical protein
MTPLAPRVSSNRPRGDRTPWLRESPARRGSTEPPLPVLVFAPWDDPIHATHLAPDSPYSRAGWLPMLGPNAWVLWGTIAAELVQDAEVAWLLDQLAWAHRFISVERSLGRLERFRLAAPTDDDHWIVRTTCPRLSTGQLARSPAWVQTLHHDTFPGSLRPTARLGAPR